MTSQAKFVVLKTGEVVDIQKHWRKRICNL